METLLCRISQSDHKHNQTGQTQLRSSHMCSLCEEVLPLCAQSSKTCLSLSGFINASSTTLKDYFSVSAEFLLATCFGSVLPQTSYCLPKHKFKPNNIKNAVFFISVFCAVYSFQITLESLFLFSCHISTYVNKCHKYAS